MSQRSTRGGGALLGVLLALGSCAERPITDGSGGAVAPPASPGSAVPGSPPGKTGCPPAGAPPSALRRLRHHEYDNTVRDLTGFPGKPSERLAREWWLPALVGPAGPWRPEDLEGVFRASVEVAAYLRGERLATLLGGCDPAREAPSECAAQFIAGFGARAYRRPLWPEEAAILEEAYRSGAAGPGGGFADGIEAVVLSVLMAPQFLHRVELGEPRPAGGGPGRLDSWELASRLSYLLWGTMPDAPLWAAAERGALSAREEVAAQVARMLGDPRAREQVAHFHRLWLGLDRLEEEQRDPGLHPSFTPQVRSDMRREVDRFAADQFWGQPGDLSSFLLSPDTFVTPALAAHYGIALPAPAADGVEQRYRRDPARHAGVLTLGALMTATSRDYGPSPVERGMFVREVFLCTARLPPPPPLVIDPPPPSRPGNLTMRERLTEHSNNPSCRSCHRLIDPLGFALDHLDEVGRWRDTENGRSIDTTGELVDAAGVVAGTFDGAVELARLLSTHPPVRRCLVQSWFELAFGRLAESSGPAAAADACTLRVMERQFSTGGYRLRDLPVAVTETDAFRFQQPGGRP